MSAAECAGGVVLDPVMVKVDAESAQPGVLQAKVSVTGVLGEEQEITPTTSVHVVAGVTAIVKLTPPGGSDITTFAKPLLVTSSTEVAVMVAPAVFGAAVNSPPVEMVPVVLVQVTALENAPVPCTLALHWLVDVDIVTHVTATLVMVGNVVTAEVYVKSSS